MSYDPWSVRLTIGLLGFVVIASTVTACILALRGQAVDALIASLISGTVALLVPSPLSKAKTDEVVEVTNPPGEALAVEPE